MSGHDGLKRFCQAIRDLAEDLKVELPDELISIVRGMDPVKCLELNFRMACGNGPELHSSPHAHHICGIIGGYLVVPVRIAEAIHKHLGDPGSEVIHRGGMWVAVRPHHWFMTLIELLETDDFPEIYGEGPSLLLTA